MNKGKSKKKMNSYLKMILLMAAGGVVGGIVGFVTAFSGEDYIACLLYTSSLLMRLFTDFARSTVRTSKKPA